MKIVTPALLGIAFVLLGGCSVTSSEKTVPIAEPAAAEADPHAALAAAIALNKKPVPPTKMTVMRWYLPVFAACPKGAAMIDANCTIRRARNVTADSTYETEQQCDDAAEAYIRTAAKQLGLTGEYDSFWRCVDTLKNNADSKERQTIYLLS